MYSPGDLCTLNHSFELRVYFYRPFLSLAAAQPVPLVQWGLSGSLPLALVGTASSLVVPAIAEA